MQFKLYSLYYLMLFAIVGLVYSNLWAFDIGKVEFIRCYDGDTCTFNILDSNFPNYLNPMSIRVYGVDTPEIRSKDITDKKLAYKAKEFTIKFVKTANTTSSLILKNCKKDKYFRFDCEYWNSNKSLADSLINSNLGVPYFGERKR